MKMKLIMCFILIGWLILGTVWFQGGAQTLPLVGKTSNSFPTDLPNSLPLKQNPAEERNGKSSSSALKTTTSLFKNNLNFVENNSQSYKWDNLILTLDSDGTLHIPRGIVKNYKPLGDVLGSQSSFVKKIIFEDSLKVPGTLNKLFVSTNVNYHFDSLKIIEGLSNIDTSNVTDMSWMFSYCSSLENLDLSSFNTSNVITMNSMFSYCTSLKSLNLSSFNTSKVTNMSSMFNYCTSLESLDLSSFNTSKVTDMSSMFNYCTSLQNLNVSSFNTSKVTDMSWMFTTCSSLENLDLSSFNTSNVTTMDYMFGGSRSLQNLNVSSFNTSNVTNLRDMFINCHSLEILDLSSFDTPKLNNIVGTFEGCTNLKKLDISRFDLSNALGISDMFYGINQLFSLKIGPKFTTRGYPLDLVSPPTHSPYTGKWQNIGTGTEDTPKGKNIWTSEELSKNYNGSTDADEYVWQKRYTPPLLTSPRITQKTIPAGNQRVLSGFASPNEKIEVQELNGSIWATLGVVTSDDQGKWVFPPIKLPAQVTLRMIGYDENNSELIGTSVSTINAQIPDITEPTAQGGFPTSEVTVKGTGQYNDLIQLQYYNEKSKIWENAPEQKSTVTVTSHNSWEVPHIELKKGRKWRAQAYRPDGEDASVYSKEINFAPISIPVITSPQITHNTIPAEKQTILEGTGSSGSQLTAQKYITSNKTWEMIEKTTVADTGKWEMPPLDLSDKEQIRILAQFPGDSDSAETSPIMALTPKEVKLITPKYGKNNTISTSKDVTFSGTGQADDLVSINIMKAGSSSWLPLVTTSVQSNGTWSCKGGDLLMGDSYQILTRRPGGQSTSSSVVYKIVGIPGNVKIINDNITINVKGDKQVDTMPVGTVDIIGSGQIGDTIHLEYKDNQHTDWNKAEFSATTVNSQGIWTIKKVEIKNGVQWRAISDVGTGVEETSNVIVGMSPTEVNLIQPKVIDGGIDETTIPILLKGTGQQNDIVHIWLKEKNKDWEEISQTNVDTTGNWTSESIRPLMTEGQIKVITQRPKGTETKITGPYDIVHVINPKNITINQPLVTNNTVPSGANQTISGIGQPGDKVSLFWTSLGINFSEGDSIVDTTGHWRNSQQVNMKAGEHWYFEITHKYSDQKITLNMPLIVDPEVVSITSPKPEEQRLLPNSKAYFKGTGQVGDLVHLEYQKQGDSIWEKDTDTGTIQIDEAGNWAFHKPVNLVLGDTWKIVTNRPGGISTKELVLPIKGPRPQLPIIQTPQTYQKTITNEKSVEVSGTGQAGDTLQLEVRNIGQTIWETVQRTMVTEQGTWNFNPSFTLPIGSQFKIISSRIGWPDVETGVITNQMPQLPVLTKPAQIEGTIRPEKEIWQGSAGPYDYVQLQYQSEGSDTWKNSIQVIANSDGTWVTPQEIITNGGENWRIIAYRPTNPTINAMSDTYFVVNGAPEKPKLETPIIYQDDIPDDDNTVFSGTGHPGDKIQLEYTASIIDHWHLAPGIESKVEENGKFKLPPYSLVNGNTYRLIAHVPGYDDATSDKWEAIAPDKLTNIEPNSSPLSSGNIDWTGKGKKYDFVFWQKYNNQKHAWEDQSDESEVESGWWSNTFKMTTKELKKGDILRLVTHRKGGQRRVYGSTYYVEKIYPKITGPYLTNKTIPTDELTTLTGNAQPNILLTISSRDNGGDWKEVKTIQAQSNGEWNVEIGSTHNKEEFQVKDSNGEDSVTALDPALPTLITPEHTDSTMKAQTDETFSGTGQVDDELEIQIRDNSDSPWETKGKTKVNAQGEWTIKGITTLDNQELRLVTYRPGGIKKVTSSTWIVTASNDYILIVPNLNLTEGKIHQKSGEGTISILDSDGTSYKGSNKISVTMKSKNNGSLYNNTSLVASYYLQIGGQRLVWKKTLISLDKSSTSKTFEAYLENIFQPKINGKDQIEYESVIDKFK